MVVHDISAGIVQYFYVWYGGFIFWRGAGPRACAHHESLGVEQRFFFIAAFILAGHEHGDGLFYFWFDIDPTRRDI